MLKARQEEDDLVNIPSKENTFFLLIMSIRVLRGVYNIITALEKLNYRCFKLGKMKSAGNNRITWAGFISSVYIKQRSCYYLTLPVLHRAVNTCGITELMGLET